MEQLVKKLLVVVGISLNTANALAYDFKVDGIYYNILSVQGKIVEVTYRSGSYNSYSGDVVIPEQVQYNEELYSVTSIGSNAFEDCSSLASVTIPEGVTSIGDRAFYYCSSLASVTIPESVTSIGYRAFYGCSSLASVTIPESVTFISDYAFAFCSSLASVTIPEGVTSIGSGAFYYCSSLASVTIPESVTSIGDSAFYGCSSLASVTIPESVTSIGGWAFFGCSSLASVNISDLSAWCRIDFEGYRANPLYYGHNLYLNGVLVTDLVIPEDVSEIKSCAFSGCSLTSVTIPEGVTSIGYSAFYDCSSLASVTIPEGVTSIGECAFEDCSSLTSVTILEGVTSIGYSAFRDCSSLASVTIPKSVTSIVYSAFRDCSSLTSVNISDLSAWCRIDFGGYESNPLYYGHNLYLNGALVTDLVIPEDISEIKSYAFLGGSCVTSVTIPNSVTTIGSSAFGDCESIEKVISLNQTPPKIDYSIFEYSVLSNAILYVPEGSLKAYLMANGWQFVKIREIENGAVSSLEDDAINVTTKDGRIVVEDAQGAVVEVYNAGGQLIYICTDSEIEIPEKGIYVVRVSGRTFKIAVL